MSSAASFVNESITFTPEVIAATEVYARLKPWRGSAEEQVDKLHSYHAALCLACDVDVRLDFVVADLNLPGAGLIEEGAIKLAGKISLVTYWYWFAAALYCDETPAERHKRSMTFSVNLFRICFPRSFRRANLDGQIVRTVPRRRPEF